MTDYFKEYRKKNIYLTAQYFIKVKCILRHCQQYFRTQNFSCDRH
jgi:hypothetical protein